METETHLHFIVQVYRDMQPDGALSDVTTVDVIAASYGTAVARARVIVPPSLKGDGCGYRISQVIEHFGERCERG